MSTSSSPEPTTKSDEVKGSGTRNIPEPLTTLPNLVTDEEGTAIPEASDGASMYQYRDFSNVPEEELERQPSTPPPSSNSRGAVESSIRVQKFPVKLYAILAQKEFQDIITWMPHGRSWKVLKPNLFESLVMPLFFEYSNYHSFNRLVNAWSFRRISSGPDRGSYYHELFLRGKPYLQKYMRRLPKTHKKLPMKKDDEPDFYGMDKKNPLPVMEDVPLTPPRNFSTANGMPLSNKSPGMPGPIGRGTQGQTSPSGYHGMAGLHGMPSMNGMNSMGGGASGAFMEPSLLSGSSRHVGMGMGPSGMGGMMGAPGMMGGNGPSGMMGGGIPFRESQFGGNVSSPMSGHMSGMGMTNGMGVSPGMGMSGGMPGMGMTMGGMGFRETQFGAGEMGMGGSGMGGMGGAMNPGMYGAGASSAADMAEYQRLRQIQQMHMLDRQHMTGPVRRF